MTTDAQALAIATRALPTEPRADLHMALAVARTESHYSDNWHRPEGNPNNWGGVQATGGEPSFPHLDHHADGSPYTGQYAVNPTPEAGFKQVAFNVLKPNVRAAAEAGNGTQAVQAMHQNGYFELDPVKYAAAVELQYNGFLASTGEPRLLTFPPLGAPQTTAPSSGGSGLVDVAVAIGLAAATAWALDFLPKPKAPPKGDQ